MRGQPELTIIDEVACRIIPARAGPTRLPARLRCHHADHPRSCGANSTVASEKPYLLGSSPLVRGQRYHQNQKSAQRRIIPARAGPTRLPPPRHRRFPDHPRSCGANSTTCATCLHGCGSSPLVRGQRNRDFPSPLTQRIIPARAGPTLELPGR